MVVPRLVPVIVALVLSGPALMLNGPPAHAGQRPASENEKIEALIKHIEGLADAKFVRNGSEYDAKTAAKFLRRKWESKKEEIKTAQDFIDKVASVSSTSGKPYLIRKDGKDTKSGEYLMEQLKKLGE
jgi:hypothetical protein